MATPTMVTISGVLQVQPGEVDLSATIQFKRRVFVQHADGTVIEPGTQTAVVASDGSFSLDVMATNDPAWTPVGWTYRVTISTGDVERVYEAAVPYTDTTQVLPLPVLQSDGTLYAASNHGHEEYVTVDGLGDYVQASELVGYVTDAELLAALGPFIDSTEIEAYASDAELAAGLAAFAYTLNLAYDLGAAALPRTGGTMTGPLTIRAGDNSKGYRLRQDGGALDLEFGNAELWLAGKEGVDGDPFGGAQFVVMKLRSDQLFQTAVGKWEWTDGPYGGARHELDGVTGVARLGSKNGLPMMAFCGRRKATGAPTTGTWNTDDVVLSDDGLYECTAGGSPGVWSKRG